MMTEQEMLETLEMARKSSWLNGRSYGMSNGKNIMIANTDDQKKWLESKGYWTCSIFEWGHRVES